MYLTHLHNSQLQSHLLVPSLLLPSLLQVLHHVFWIFGVYDSENKCSDPHWNVETGWMTAPFLTRQLGSAEMVYWMLIYLRMSYFAQYLCPELGRILCISVFKAGKSQLKILCLLPQHH